MSNDDPQAPAPLPPRKAPRGTNKRRARQQAPAHIAPPSSPLSSLSAAVELARKGPWWTKLIVAIAVVVPLFMANPVTAVVVSLSSAGIYGLLMLSYISHFQPVTPERSRLAMLNSVLVALIILVALILSVNALAALLRDALGSERPSEKSAEVTVPMRDGKVVITLKEGPASETAPQTLEDLRPLTILVPELSNKGPQFDGRLWCYSRGYSFNVPCYFDQEACAVGRQDPKLLDSPAASTTPSACFPSRTRMSTNSHARVGACNCGMSDSVPGSQFFLKDGEPELAISISESARSGYSLECSCDVRGPKTGFALLEIGGGPPWQNVVGQATFAEASMKPYHYVPSDTRLRSRTLVLSPHDTFYADFISYNSEGAKHNGMIFQQLSSFSKLPAEFEHRLPTEIAWRPGYQFFTGDSLRTIFSACKDGSGYVYDGSGGYPPVRSWSEVCPPPP